MSYVALCIFPAADGLKKAYQLLIGLKEIHTVIPDIHVLQVIVVERVLHVQISYPQYYLYFRPSPVLEESSSTPRQASSLEWLMAILSYWQASSYSFLLLDTCFLNLFILLMASLTTGVTQETFTFPGFVLPICFLAALVIIVWNSSESSLRFFLNSMTFTEFIMHFLWHFPFLPALAENFM